MSLMLNSEHKAIFSKAAPPRVARQNWAGHANQHGIVCLASSPSDRR